MQEPVDIVLKRHKVAKSQKIAAMIWDNKIQSFDMCMQSAK